MTLRTVKSCNSRTFLRLLADCTGMQRAAPSVWAKGSQWFIRAHGFRFTCALGGKGCAHGLPQLEGGCAEVQGSGFAV